MQTKPIQLGGKTYTLTAQPLRKSRKWRKKFAEPFGQVAELIQSFSPNGAGEEIERVSLTNTGNLSRVITSLKDLVIASPDTAFDLLLDYSAELRADEEYLLEHATDDEVIAALAEVLKLAYPFGAILQIVNNGLARAQTSTRSASPSGASGATK